MRRVLIALCAVLCILSATLRAGAQTASSSPQAGFSGVDAVLVATFYGLFSQLVMEDIDRPQILRTDASQKNVDLVLRFYRLLRRDPETQAQIEHVRPMLRGDEKFNHDEAARSFNTLELGIANSMHPLLKQAFFAGALTQQTLFNAAGPKQREYDLQYRKFLASATVLDQVSPDIARARTELSTLPDDADWEIVATDARTLAKLITGATVSAMEPYLSPAPARPSPAAT
jgi:hypothetical protein